MGTPGYSAQRNSQLPHSQPPSDSDSYSTGVLNFVCNVSLLQVQSCKRAITAVVGPAKLAASCRGALSHGSLQPQPRHTMQIALPGSLHRVIMWLCTHSQLSTTVEAHDADRPAGLAASCHRVAVQQRALSHSYPPQPRRTMQIALPGSLHRVAVRSVPAFNHVRAICTCVRVPCLWCSDLVGCQ